MSFLFDYFKETARRICILLLVLKELTSADHLVSDSYKKQLETLSSFSVAQVDVSGNCSSEYKIVSVQEDETEIIKTRNLSQCNNRSSNFTKLNPVMYNVNSVRRLRVVQIWLPYFHVLVSCKIVPK